MLIDTWQPTERESEFQSKRATGEFEWNVNANANVTQRNVTKVTTVADLIETDIDNTTHFNNLHYFILDLF